jgi:hypothetical protein
MCLYYAGVRTGKFGYTIDLFLLKYITEYSIGHVWESKVVKICPISLITIGTNELKL